ncbi:thiamine transport system permease protein [Monaibacterium marinum]|uniref:Thiamine transport system permease protein n=1 Tax=Pontivivens marinum TaxID=1690039 RepID=A0A2C9CSX0_9RHOB|nr:ABC transporter permease subunit [Monaibacterium marinum]SOH94300.1 thiamine transport system permease protein [Monaibacterium marinum]
MKVTGWVGIAAGLLILLSCAAAISALIGASGGAISVSGADFSAIRFTLLQAALSALGSLLIAVPLARALARRRFRGRDLLVTAMGAPFLLPVLVAVLGLLAIWGRNGVLSALMESVGAERLNIYGLTGVVLAHLFFNIPLVTRLLLQGWATIPPEHLRLGQQLGFGPVERFRLIEMPMLRTVLPGAGLLVFLLCISSFAIALTLGGGPRATTLELAIYQAIRFEFDLPRAGTLAMIQTGLCLIVAAVTMLIARPGEARAGMIHPDPFSPPEGRVLDGVVIASVAMFLSGPVLAVILRGAPALLELPYGVVEAAIRSILVALSSAILTVGVGMALSIGLVRMAELRPRLARVFEAAMLLVLVISPFVLATGWFILLRGHVDPFAIALPMVVTINALMALPFALRAFVPAVAMARRTDGRLADMLGLTGYTRLRHVLLPHMRGPAAFAAGLAAALSMGDLGVIALFGSTTTATLPLVMYQLMGAYRMEAAAGAALLLLLLSFGMFAVIDRLGKSHDPV